MTLALTGATGFVGSHVAEAALASGISLRGVVRSPARGAWLAERGLPLVAAELGDRPALARAFAGCEAVIANAALRSFTGSLDEMVRTNVTGTENTLRAAADAGVRRIVYISTVAVYRTAILRPMSEDHPRYGHQRRAFSWTHLTSDWRYAVSKCVAEDRAWEVAAELGLSMTVLRPGPIFGSRDTRWTGRILRQLSRKVALAPTVGIPLVHVGDVAAAVLAAATRPETAGHAYNLAGPPVSVLRVIRTLRTLAGRGPLLIPVPLPLWVAYDCRAAQRELGFATRTLEEGLTEVLGAPAC